MTKSEQIEILQGKAKNLIDWFEDKPMPQSFQFSKSAFMHDSEKYKQSQINRMEANWENPFHLVFVGSYYKLLTLKEYLENK